jgi:hypothetical protein
MKANAWARIGLLMSACSAAIGGGAGSDSADLGQPCPAGGPSNCQPR